MQLDLTVVIPTYNRVATLRHVIPSLLASQTAARFEIVVADSQSSDGTAGYLAEVAAADSRVRHLPGAYTGRAMARNAGIAAARGDVVLFTDADIIASPELLERHLEHHRNATKIAVVGMELQVGSLADYERLRDRPEERRPLHPDKRKHVSWLYFLTGNASVRREDLERVGCFDEHFTGYGHEDLELGYRLQQGGLEIRYEPRAVDYHWHPVPYEEQKEKMRLAGRSTVRFFRKHPSFAVKARLGMTPVSLALHGAIAKAPGLLQRLDRTALERPGFARNVVLQYHYVGGIKDALEYERA
ncbi:MAG: glycosyltransferase family 2 protein [Candidatus Eremiobacteraeota bacterium]|nr:glycosyltransferase family 2 protein [Candidatus Eremiobacteraeota bacterium]